MQGAARVAGRDGELASALATVDRVAAATGQALLVEGEAGIGKTTLLERVLDDCRRRGFRVVVGAGRALEAELPFAPFVGALRLRPEARDDRRAAIGRLLAPAAEPPGDVQAYAEIGQRRLWLLQAIVDLVEELCEDGPVVLALEDVHWVDVPSLAVVDRLASRLRHLPLLVLLSARPYPRSDHLEGLVGRLLPAGATHLRLRPLATGAVAEVAHEVLGAPPDPQVVQQLAAAGGNPLFVTELLGALSRDGAIEIRDGHATLTRPTGVPSSVKLTVLRRLSVLPETTVEVLRSAAVLGTSFDVAQLAAFVGRSPQQVVRQLDPARSSGVVGERGGELAFRHDVVREAVYEDLPTPARRALHAAAAASLAEAGHPAEVVAPHLLRASLTADTSTIGQLRRTASQLLARAPEVAVDLLRRAAALAPTGPGMDGELQLQLATALAWAHRPEEAARVADEVLREVRAGPLRRAALTLRATQAQFLGGFERFRADLEAAAAEPDATAQERARLLALATASWVFSDDPQRALRLGREALRAAEDAEDDVASCAAAQSLSVASEASGDVAGAIDHARAAVDLWRRSSDPELHRLQAPELVLATVIGHSPQHRDEALELARRGVIDAERRGLPEFAVSFQLILGATLWRAGRWDEAAVELEAGIERARELGRQGSKIVDACCRLARLAVHRGDLAAAGRWLQEAETASGGEPTSPDAVALAIARAELLAADDAVDEATAELRDTFARLPAAVRPVLAPPIAIPLVRLVPVAGGSVGEAEVVAAVVDDGKDMVAPWLRALLERSPDLALEAVGRARRHGTTLRTDVAELCEDTAALLAASGREEEAVSFLEEAVEVWEEVGAARDVARVEARLRDVGVRRGRRGPRNRPATGWASLTDTERRVVELVADGLLYREVAERMFISRRTVETHVAHVFAKVGVGNRRELEHAYHEHRGVATAIGRDGSPWS